MASPADLAAEREVVRRVAERLNRLGAEWEPVYDLELVDWSSHAASHLDGPPGETPSPLPVADDDLFLGMAWLRFGRPEDDGELPDRDGFHSGTEEEFELAYRSWAQLPRPQSMFYRCRRMPAQLTDINGAELVRLDAFYSRFEDADQTSLYGEFTSADELEERLQDDLIQLIQKILSARTKVKARPPAIVELAAASRDEEAQAVPRAEFEKKMAPGKAYEVTFLSIEIVKFQELAEQFQRKQKELATLLRSVERLVVDTAASYGGEVFSWEGERGLMIFWSQRNYDHAIITGLKIIHSLPVFNVDPQQNPLPVHIEIRTAAHDAVIVFQLPASNITSPEIDFAVRLREKYSNPRELCISKRLLDRADSRLQSRFTLKGRFEREPIYSCVLPSTEQHALQAKVEELIDKVRQQAALIKDRLRDPAATIDEIPAVEVIGAAVDETYGLLEHSCSVLSNLNGTWSQKFFSQLAATVSVLVQEEAELWQALRRCHRQHPPTSELAVRLESIVRSAASLRSRPAVTLTRIAQSLQARSEPAPPRPPEPTREERPEIDADLVKKVDFLLRADPLDQETALTDLLLHKKSGLLEFLRSEKGDERHTALLGKLWETADFVFLDDLYSIRGHQRADEEKIHHVLIDEPIADVRFQVVHDLLGETFKPAEALVREHFETRGLKADNRDLQIVWRCLVLGHPVLKIRTLSAFKLSQFAMWQAISYPNIPIASIHAIGERVAKIENDDVKKIFFDCTRSRIATVVETFRTREELATITNLIMLLLDFSFLVETGYFERFDDILGGFLARSQKLGLKVDYFEDLRKRLESARRDPDAKTAGRPPAGIKKLPLTLQRRLAGEAQYLFWFVTHPDARIASETLRHVSLGNVERVLKLAEINGAVMTTLLRKPELFTRSQPVIAALNNPKCDLRFAGRYLQTFVRSRGGIKVLETIARNPSANPAVRGAVRQAVQQAQKSR